jgi:hypothetical protein
MRPGNNILALIGVVAGLLAARELVLNVRESLGDTPSPQTRSQPMPLPSFNARERLTKRNKPAPKTLTQQ